MYDVIVIGAGVSGCAVARELSRYKASVCVLEKCEDVCEGTSKANSGIVHAGFDAEPGSVMARLNVRGNEMMDDLARDLDIPFKRIGSMVVCTDESQRDGLDLLLARGKANGVKGLRILERAEALEMEPNLSGDTVAVLYAPTGGIVCPFELNIAMAENAFVNGVEFRFNTRVEDITRNEEGLWVLRTNNGQYMARCVVNAAGVYADRIHNMVSQETMHIIERRGEYILMDKEAGDHVSHTIFALPTKYGKGVLVTPTVHGNLLAGPTAIDMENKEGTATTAEGLAQVTGKAGRTVRNVPLRKVITSFAGLRAHLEQHDFVIGPVSGAPGFFDVAGIESPGLTASPAIGEMAAGLVRELLGLEEKSEWIGTRKGIRRTAGLSPDEMNALIREEPAYGTIVCRCESVTEGEILDAIRRPLGARSLDGIKRRTRAGMGRCQSGFCSPRTMEIISRELGLSYEEITKCGGRSVIAPERTKGEVTEA